MPAAGHRSCCCVNAFFFSSWDPCYLWSPHNKLASYVQHMFGFCRLLTVCAVVLSQQLPMLAMVAPVVPSAVGTEPGVTVMVSAAMSKGHVCVTLVTR